MKRIFSVFLAFMLLCGLAFAESEISQYQKPSRAWLSEVSCDITDAIAALSCDSGYVASIGLPDSVLAYLSPTQDYEAEPIAVLYCPDGYDAAQAILALAGSDSLPDFVADDSSRLFTTFLRSAFYQYCTTEQLALSNSIMLTDYIHCRTPVAPAVALYMPADSEAQNCIMAEYTWKDGILSISACFMPKTVAVDIISPAASVGPILDMLGVEILTSAEPDIGEFAADMTAPADLPDATEEWLADAAIGVAEKMIAQLQYPEYARLFTADEELLDICGTIGAIDLSSAVVRGIEYYDLPYFTNMFGLSLAQENKPLYEKYCAVNIPSFILQSKINTFGVHMVAAASVCRVSEVLPANADFTACIVILDCGGQFDIGVAAGIDPNGFAILSAMPLPKN